jgi:hypothetical protein
VLTIPPSLMNAFSQLGNIAGSYVWDKKFGPLSFFKAC